MYYAHRPAHKGYRETLIESRTGVNISEEELRQLDSFLSPLIKKGQSIHHITVNNPDEFTVCEKTLYRYVSGGLLKARNIDMPRVCRLKMKPRRSKPLEHKVDSKCRIGRTYEDFKSFMAQVDPPAVVEMDTVIGKIGGKVLLTLIFGSCDFMLAILRDHNTSQSIINAFSDLYHLLGVNQFRRLFPVLLTDRGTEFSNPTALEFDSAGIKRSMVFYCDPGASFQKPHIEVGHEFIRRVLPKGSSFDHLCQADIDIMMSHINSYSREKWGDKCPYELFELLYGKGTTDKFNIRRIPPNEIILKPELLKRK
jgi:IS30 family transposase